MDSNLSKGEKQGPYKVPYSLTTLLGLSFDTTAHLYLCFLVLKTHTLSFKTTLAKTPNNLPVLNNKDYQNNLIFVLRGKCQAAYFYK